MSRAPTATVRQINNMLCRHMGFGHETSYHTRVRKGDRVRVQIVEEEPFEQRRFMATIRAVDDHGSYVLVDYVDDHAMEGQLQLPTDGPPDWGVVEFRIVSRGPVQRQPDKWDSLAMLDGDPEDRVQDALGEPQRCPDCQGLYDYRPIDGWPCLACRARWAANGSGP